MILNRSFYNKISFWKGFWYRKQAKKLKTERVFKAFKLHKTEWPGKLYFYSPRLKRLPRFVGNQESLAKWEEAKNLEKLCPTNAIKVKSNEIGIDDRGCICCGACVEYAPEGLLEYSVEFPLVQQDIS